MKYHNSLILSLLLPLIFTKTVYAENIIRIVSGSVQTGDEFTVQVQVDNTNPFVAFQADINIPDGFIYMDGFTQLVQERVSDHILSTNMIGTTIRLIAYSVSNTAFSGTSGTLITFRLKTGTVPGNFSLTISKTLLSDVSSQPMAHSTINGIITILGPNINFINSSADFGRIALTSSGTQKINIQNTGNQNLTVNAINFSNDQFSSPESGGFTLSAGQSRQVSVVFTPSVKGKYAETMHVISNDPDTPEAKINLNAIAFSINELHCSSITSSSGSTGRLEFAVNNMEPFTGLQFDLILPSPMIHLENSAVLYRQMDHTVSTNMINSTTLRVVAFSVLGQNFIGNNGKILSLDFNLFGVGGNYPISLTNVIIANNGGENITSAYTGNTLKITAPDIFTTNTLNFGDVSIFSFGQQNLNIYNQGQEPLVIQQLDFSSSWFTSDVLLPIIIQPNSVADISVKFQKNLEGSATGKLNILSNDPDEYPFVVNLVGNAIVPNYIVIRQFQASPGDSLILKIEVDNYKPFVAFQFDLEFPAGLTPDLNAILLSDRKQDQVVAATLIEQNRIRIIAWSPSQKSFSGSSGIVVTIPMAVDLHMVPGTYNLLLSKGLLSNSLSENILYGVKNGTLTITERILNSQSISLASGWNIISFNVIPDSTDIKAIFQPLIGDESLVKVQDETGNSLEDYGFLGGWIDNIRGIFLTEGYKVKVNKDCQLTLQGIQASLPFKIPLKTGWNIIGYPLTIEFDGEAVVQQLISRGTLIKVQDETGNAIEDYGILGGWTNNIGDFRPGEGYKIKVARNDTLTLSPVPNAFWQPGDPWIDPRDSNFNKTVKIGK